MVRWSRFRFVVIPAVVIIALVILLVRSCAPAAMGADYRDPAVLAQAVEVTGEKAGDGTPTSATCARLVFPAYVCSVAFSSGATVTVHVQVAADGSWWHTTRTGQ
jgi:hypothetical protein